MTFAASLLLALITTLPTILPPAGGPPGGLLSPPLPLGDWVIRTPVVLADVTLRLRGNVIVERGGILVLRGATLRMEGERDGDRTIRVESGGRLVTSYSPLTRRRSEIRRGELPGRFSFEVARGGAVQLTSTIVSGAGWDAAHPGLVIDSGEDGGATIADCDLFDNHVGITIRSGDHEIVASTVHDNEDAGLVVEGGSASVEVADFAAQAVAIRVAPAARLHLASAVVRQSNIGLWASGSSTEVDHGIFLENGFHVRFDRAAAGSLRDTVLIAALHAAVLTEGESTALLRRNDLVANRFAVWNGNDGLAPRIDARENYWGAADGPGGDAGGSGDPVSGGVEFSPWCTESCRREPGADGGER